MQQACSGISAKDLGEPLEAINGGAGESEWCIVAPEDRQVLDIEVYYDQSVVLNKHRLLETNQISPTIADRGWVLKTKPYIICMRADPLRSERELLQPPHMAARFH